MKHDDDCKRHFLHGKCGCKPPISSSSALDGLLYCVAGRGATRYFETAMDTAGFLWGKNTVDYQVYKFVGKIPVEVSEIARFLEAI